MRAISSHKVGGSTAVTMLPANQSGSAEISSRLKIQKVMIVIRFMWIGGLSSCESLELAKSLKVLFNHFHLSVGVHNTSYFTMIIFSETW